MTDNVIPLNNITRLDTCVDRAMDQGKDRCRGGVIVIGWDKDSGIYFGSSIADGGEILWLLEKTKAALLDVSVP